MFTLSVPYWRNKHFWVTNSIRLSLESIHFFAKVTLVVPVFVLKFEAQKDLGSGEFWLIRFSGLLLVTRTRLWWSENTRDSWNFLPFRFYFYSPCFFCFICFDTKTIYRGWCVMICLLQTYLVSVFYWFLFRHWQFIFIAISWQRPKLLQKVDSTVEWYSHYFPPDQSGWNWL